MNRDQNSQAIQPPDRDHHSCEKTVLSFIDHREDHLLDLDRELDPEDYSRRAHTLAGIIPCLLERGRCLEAVSIVERLVEHRTEDSDRAIIARETLAWIVKGDTLNTARQAFARVSGETLPHLGSFFVMMGEWSVPHLLRIISESDDRRRSRDAAETLFEIGPKGGAALLYEMERGHLPQDILGTVIRILGESSEDRLIPAAVIRVVGEKLHSEDNIIRQEAVQALSRLMMASPEAGEKASPLLLGLAEREYPGGRLEKLAGGRSLPTPALVSLAEAVGRIGGEGARDILRRMTRDREEAVSRKAAEALKKMAG
jgi:hypothetical protein